MESLRALVASFRSRPTWLKAVLGVALLAATGLAWSLLTPPPPSWARLPVADDDRVHVEATLDEAAIARESRPDGIYVAAADLERANARIAAGRDAIGEALAQNSLFANPQQLDQQIHHALETELARMIARLEPVRCATVRIVQGTRINFSGAGEATAAVQIDLRPGAGFSDEQARAVADMVSASVKGLKREAVKISDTQGRTYQVADSVDPSEDLRKRERRFARLLEERVDAVLPGARRVVCVRLATPKTDPRPGGWPAIQKGTSPEPTTTPAAAALSSEGDVIEQLSISVILALRHEPADREAFMRGIVAQLRHATGLDRDEYFRIDLQAAPEAAPAPSPVARVGLVQSLERLDTTWIGLVAAVALVPLVWIARRRRRAVVPPPPAPVPADLRQPEEEAAPAGPFDGIGRLSVERTLMLLGDEHAQTIALVLNHLTTRRAGEVLERIPTALQVDVVRRMTMLQAPSPEVIADVERALDRKLAIQRAQATRRTGSPQQVARILGSVDRDTGTRILLGVRAQDPELADELRGPERAE